MEAARGGVLFIDEAYALGSGSYGEEAITKLLGMLTGTTWNLPHILWPSPLPQAC